MSDDVSGLTGGAYLAMITATVERVGRGQAPAVRDAAGIISDSLIAGGVLHAFGSGHSEALAMELAGRAGGLVPTNRVAIRDLLVYGGQPPSVLDDPFLERDPEVAHRLLAIADPRPADVFVVGSNSGINGVVVEFALRVKERGHPLIAITSADHGSKSQPRHPSGKRLGDLADVVLDNGAPYGDAGLPLPDGGAIGAVSSVTAAVLAQMIVTEVVRRMIDAGHAPPVYLSANIAGGDEHNQQLEARYAGRLRRSA